MRINDDNTVLEGAGCNVQNNEEYQINQVMYQVNRFFEGDKTIKELLSLKLSSEYSASHKTYDILLLLKLRNSSMEEMTK